MTADDEVDARLLAEGHFGTALARHLPALSGRARARLPEGDAQDVVQDVAVRLLTEFQQRGGWRYPFRVVAHRRLGWQMIDYLRARPPTVPFPDGWDPPEDEDGFADLLERDYLEDLFSSLTEHQREVARLRYIDGLEIAEVAGRKDMTRNAVDQILHRIRAQLHELIAG